MHDRAAPELQRRPGGAALVGPDERPRHAVDRGAPTVPPVRRRPRSPWLHWGAKPYLLVADTVALSVLAVLAVAALGHPVPAVLVGLGTGLAALGAGGTYRPRLSRSVLDDLPYAVVGVAAAALATAVLAGARFGGGLLLAAALTVVALTTVRAAAYAAIRWAHRSRRVRSNAIVVGAGHVGLDLARLLTEHPEYGIDPVGLVDVRPRVEPGAALPAPLLAYDGDFADLVRRLDCRNVFVAFSSLREVDLIDIIRTCDHYDCEIFLVPRLFELQHTSRDMDFVWGIPLVRARRAAHRSTAWRAKRLTDVVLAGAALVLLSPLLAACVLAVRLENGPGVIFRQERVGTDGQTITVLKLRTLRPRDAREADTTWSVSEDQRVGRLSRLLRRTSVDELPQLWNVLRGDMSLVGPRPERPYFADQFSTSVPHYDGRHRVPVGLTGWAQVYGLRGDTSIVERARFDNHYIQNWSFYGDVKILVRTVSQVVRGSGG